MKMGAAESVAQEPAAQVTPSCPAGSPYQHRVADPRSPSAGIMRTPIEVEDSPECSPLLDEVRVMEHPEIADPRSPTPGITRTPLRPSLHASLRLLAKQLSEVFILEDSGMEGSPAAQAGSSATPFEEPAATELPCKSDSEAKEPEEVTVSVPADSSPSVLQPQKQRSNRSPHNSGAKKVRQRSRKAMISTAAAGRSPLKILQEDNSPSAAIHNRQMKISSSFQSEPAISLRTFKLSHSSWQTSHNKENAQYTQSEG